MNKHTKLTDLLNEVNYVRVKNPKAINSNDVIQQVKALAQKGVRSKDVQPQFMFHGPNDLMDQLMGTFQKVKNRVYFDIDSQKRESVVNESPRNNQAILDMASQFQKIIKTVDDQRVRGYSDKLALAFASMIQSLATGEAVMGDVFNNLKKINGVGW